MDLTLHTVSCHQTTETSDILGGLRPVRGKSSLPKQILLLANKISEYFIENDCRTRHELNELIQAHADAIAHETHENASKLANGDVVKIVELTRMLVSERSGISDSSSQNDPGRSSKRQKRETLVDDMLQQMESLFHRYNTLFEWADGPLVMAMKHGDLLLLDEISLAEDAVLERLNSVLEPSRTLVLAEKGACDVNENRVLEAHDSFQVFATMNPGGDFGKRELSPALRSRFTEIWVSPVTDHIDIDLVLQRVLTNPTHSSSWVFLKPRMMEYVHWFNDVYCMDPSRACADLTLSLRDILTWAHFIIEASRASGDLTAWDAYIHGARLMHLDGLGLGIGMSKDEALLARARAEAFLEAQGVEAGHSVQQLGVFDFKTIDCHFGIDPFWISTGIYPVSENSFNFCAPTTAGNVFRILRAMQLSKPVLLEGSPGVGKTTLIAALADASGHNLVRINFSEQTDISDLMGSDLPFQDNDVSGSSSVTFRWFDGVLLAAIKRGDWVLLDELNLASQSVLEGLNSCLDHRATVFVPELGESFDCPPTFRVFAAQNPLGQGGGRKGLPKSFLNRFTKVYIDSLTDDDMNMIVQTKYPQQIKIERMIEFNAKVHESAVQDGQFGRFGSPWEFNLRDVFRWCELFLESGRNHDHSSTERHLRFARTLYFDRFRTVEDRDFIASIFESVFGKVEGNTHSPSLKLSNSGVHIGDVRVPIQASIFAKLYNGVGLRSSLPVSLFDSMESVARCVAMNWPCLLVGSCFSGKTTLVRSLAELSNSSVVEISLSSSSDVSELIGCFEQSARIDMFIDIANSVIRATDTILLVSHELNGDTCALLFKLQRAMDSIESSFDEGVTYASQLLNILAESNPLSDAGNSSEDIRVIAEKFDRFKAMGLAEESHFKWKDGVLVQAMSKGHWLHLRNANLCPSAVLDRLNSVLETNGSLFLAECGTRSESTSNHREVRPHSNFRVFLSMNPEHGEVSRAMRNRCVEISLLGTSFDKKDLFDAVEKSSNRGLKSNSIGSLLLTLQNDHCPGLGLYSIYSAYMSLGNRGMGGKMSLFSLRRILLQNMDESTMIRLHKDFAEEVASRGIDSMPATPDGSEIGLVFTHSSQIRWHFRILRVFEGYCEISSNSKLLLPSHITDSMRILGDSARTDANKLFLPFVKNILRTEMRDQLTALCLVRLARDFSETSTFFLRSEGSFKHSVSAMSEFLSSILCQEPPSSIFTKWNCQDYRRELNDVLLTRLPQLLKERVWLDHIRNDLKDAQKTVLAASFYVYNGRVPCGIDECQLTPFLFLLFGAMDDWINSLVNNFPSAIEKRKLLTSLELFFAARDGIWNSLSLCESATTITGRFNFNETDFIVQWRDVQKCLQELQKFENNTFNQHEKRRLNALISSMERVIVEDEGLALFGTSILKRIKCPAVPRKTADWILLRQIRQINQSYSIDRRALKTKGWRDFTLEDIVDQRHPMLLIDNSMKRDVLGALCTVYLAITDEVPFGICLRKVTVSVLSVLDHQLSEAAALSTEIHSAYLDTYGVATQGPLDVAALDSHFFKSGQWEAQFRQHSELLMLKFSTFQIAPLAEVWCEKVEKGIIRELCALLGNKSNEALLESCRNVSKSIRKLIEVALTFSMWDVVDLRPYQTLVWVLEHEELDISRWRQCFSRILPTMIGVSTRRTWLGSSDLLHVFSHCLELPHFHGLKKDRLTTEPVQFDQSNPSVMVYSLLRDVFALQASPNFHFSFITIENYHAREVQSRNLVEILSLPDEKFNQCPVPFEVFHLFSETIGALKDSFSHPDKTQILQFLEAPECLTKLRRESILHLCNSSSNDLFLSLVDPIVLPFIQCLENLWTHKKNSPSIAEESTLAKIYVGLLRFHLLLPDSPIDPGQESLAKVSLFERRLSVLGTRLVAIQLDSKATSGELFPSLDATTKIEAEGQKLLKQRNEQQENLIERPSDVPSFFELFKETRRFAATHVSLNGILLFVNDFQRLCEQANELFRDELLRRKDQWKFTVETFCDRLSSEFESFEDIIVPLVSSLGLIKEGLDGLTELSNSRHGHDNLLLEQISGFPTRNCSTELSRTSILRLFSTTTIESTESRLALTLSKLSQLVIAKKVTTLDFDLLQAWSAMLNSMLNCIDMSNDHEGSSRDEIDDEEEFRAQFPDHRREFSNLLEAEYSGVEHVNPPFLNVENTACDPSPVQVSLSDIEIEILSNLHRSFFLEREQTADDTCRINMFRLCYHFSCKARGVMKESENVLRSISTGHVFALSLASPFHRLLETPSEMFAATKAADFHRDANPTESMKAAVPLENLTARIVKLLNAFPDNSVLSSVAQVTDRVKKLDLLATPLGKVMTGLEIILKHAQDWEQHASIRVKLGEPLAEVKRLVSAWRKLELQSWPELLRTREARYARRSRIRWLQVHKTVRALVDSFNEGHVDQNTTGSASPKWIWKGISRFTSHVSILKQSSAAGFEDIVKVLDTFCLTAPLGEFFPRLTLLSSFVRQTEEEVRLYGSDGGHLQCARALRSLWLFYDQFSSFLASKLSNQRHPFETRLQQEVKLAKWDEQTYYAMTESTERNHRKLMQILKEYDTVLDAKVISLLEGELGRGVRMDAEADVASVVPADSSFFGFLSETTIELNSLKAIDVLPTKREWTDVSHFSLLKGHHASSLERLSIRMQTLLQQHDGGIFKLGFPCVDDLTGSIFQRIDSLRGEKTTRPMKERAVVDLFRELKRQGFLATKWSVPEEIRRMGELLLLPCPTIAQCSVKGLDYSALDMSERYYQRCVAEMYRFRAELSLLGSKHMTVRQLDTMLGFGEHGLLLILQQRCIISNILAHRQELSNLCEAVRAGESFSVYQSVYKYRLTAFRKEYANSIESMRQLLLLLKASQQLFVARDKVDWSRVTISRLETFLVDKDIAFPNETVLIVPLSESDTVTRMLGALTAASCMLQSFRDECVQLEPLPLEVFDVCLDHISVAKKAAHLYLDSSHATTAVDSETRLSSFLNVTSLAVHDVLLTAQKCVTGPDKSDTIVEESFEYIWNLHRATASSWSSINIRRMELALRAVIDELLVMHETDTVDKCTRDTCAGLSADIGYLVSSALDMVDQNICQYLAFYRGNAKFQYVLLRIFRVLAAKGFCDSKANETNDSDGAEGALSGMTFEDDVAGTGMGEGDGKRDVSDQIENEEQLLGLKDDQTKEDQSNSQPQSKQLDEEEAEKGMEMEANFEGDLCDLPEKRQNEDENGGSDDEEEVDREMGDGGDPNEEIIDEKLWNESDDEDDGKGSEKMEQDSSVKGDGTSNEMMTRDDSQADPAESQDAAERSANGDDVDQDSKDDEMINDDCDERYEDNQGVNVRDEREAGDGKNDKEDLDLDDNLSIVDSVEGSFDEPNEDLSLEGNDLAGTDEKPQADEQDVDVDEEDDNNDSEIQAEGNPAQANSESNEEKSDPADDQEKNRVDLRNSAVSQQGLGVRDQEGNDAVQDDTNADEEETDGSKEMPDTADGEGMSNSGAGVSGSGNDSGSQDGQNLAEVSKATTQQNQRDDIPNPLKNPGDASLFWHNKLNMIKTQPDLSDSVNENAGVNIADDQDADGDFEYSQENQKSTTQALGETEENTLLEKKENDHHEERHRQETKNDRKQTDLMDTSKQRKPSQPEKKTDQDASEPSLRNDMETDENPNEDIVPDIPDAMDGYESSSNEIPSNQVTSDLSQLRVEDDIMDQVTDSEHIVQVEQIAGISSEEVSEARMRWSIIQSETYNLSRRLCEKLRLVMEPLVASKLRGDYRTGKRINMKRIIGYIASGYRKDKIWLRRTRPAKRNYRVLVAVDDSESMMKSGAGEMALKAMATLAVGMSQLEIGDLGVASFGNEMNLIHPFHQPFTSESGSNVVGNFRFDQQRTRTALCVESAMMALDEMNGDRASMQLVFMISDGRIERDSRSSIRRLVREMVAKNILMVLIIVEGTENRKDSIINMKEVTFENGKPNVKPFIEDFPFPYYIILNDMNSLPEVLGDALRQWFEMLATLHATTA